jgi:ubiquinone/menaquinone biosynthesis C-methylase UbiE
VTVSDINVDMLRVGAERAKSWRFPAQANFVEANAEALPFDDESFDAYTIAFGIRNVPRIPLALKRSASGAEARRALPLPRVQPGRYPGARPKSTRLFSDQVIPPIGRAVTGDAQPYQYLVESIRKFPTPEHFSKHDRRCRVQAGDPHAVHRQYRGAARGLEALTPWGSPPISAWPGPASCWRARARCRSPTTPPCRR